MISNWQIRRAVALLDVAECSVMKLLSDDATNRLNGISAAFTDEERDTIRKDVKCLDNLSQTLSNLQTLLNDAESG